MRKIFRDFWITFAIAVGGQHFVDQFCIFVSAEESVTVVSAETASMTGFLFMRDLWRKCLPF